MTKTIAAAFLATGLITIGAAPAGAQPAPTKNIFIDANFGTQPTSGTFTISAAPIVYGETAPITSTQPFSGAPFLDVSGGYRVWRDLSVGLALTTTFSSTSSATVIAGIPSPIFFDRRVSTTIVLTDLERKERTAHLVVQWTTPVSDKVDASIMAGPSYVKVFQDLVQGVTVAAGTQTPTATADTQTATAIGFHFGGDLTFLLRPKIGVGGMFRYVKATVDLPASPDMKAGGIQLGGGLRIRF